MSDRIELTADLTQHEPWPAPRELEDGSLRILILGDFSGRGEQAARRVVPIDIDNFDDVLARVSPRAEFGESGQSSSAIEFKSLDDFHPDRLYQRLDVFQALRELRDRLLDPATASEAIAKLQQLGMAKAPQAPVEAGPAEPVKGDVFDLGLLPRQASSGQSKEPNLSARDEFQQWLRQLVQPHLTTVSDAAQANYAASIDAAVGAVMRQILHSNRFQTLESAWRGVDWLLRSLPSEGVEVHFLNIAKSELAADLDAGDLQNSAVYRLLVEEGRATLDGQPWSLLVGNYTFDAGAADVQLLASLGELASSAGGLFLAGASPEIVGSSDTEGLTDPMRWKAADNETQKHWRELRSNRAASSIGLAMPRFLLRLPYGQDTDPTDHFDFEELLDSHRPADFLWGNPALACAALLGRALFEGGSSEDVDRELDDLPTYIYKEAGQSLMLPCAEVFLSERSAKAILGFGIMPLVSHKNRGAVLLPRFCSLASTAS